MTKKIGFISLGCDKNRVDLEKMMYLLKSAGFHIVEDLNEANCIVVNTCAFILPARKESIETILEIIGFKGKNNLEKIVVTGCLPQKSFNDLIEAIPEVDAFVKLKDNENIASIVENLFDEKQEKIKIQSNPKRILSTPSHYAYLKIADGCNNACAYCTIPSIRGRYVSAPIKELVKEAKGLAELGVKELILVAQDTTRYGIDLENRQMLCELCEELSKIKEIHWIRLHYLYPEMVSNEMLDMIENNPKICPYLDIPFQHISNNMLSKMGRRSKKEDIILLLEKIGKLKRRVAVRSTFIVGFPGETKQDFCELCDFLQKFRLDNVGFFPYSREENTRACYMENQVSSMKKNFRLKKIQKIQNAIAEELGKSRIGEVCDIIIDNFDNSTGFFVGRDKFNSPNVDFCVMIESDKDLKIGEIYKAKITDFNKNFLKGEII